MKALLSSKLIFLALALVTLGWPSAHAQTPNPQAATTACPDNYGITIRGAGFAPDAGIDVRAGGSWGAIIDSFYGGQVARTNEAGQNVLRFTITNPSTQQALNSGGLWLWVVNPSAGTWTGPVSVSRTAPGTPGMPTGVLGGTYGYDVRLVGANFAANAAVDVRSSAGGAVLQTFSGSQISASCDGDSTALQFSITDAAQRAALSSTGLYFWVVNPSASAWNGPVQLVRSGFPNPPSNPTGSVSVNPTSCTIPSGQSVCSTQVSWSAANTSTACIWKTTPAPVQLWQCGLSGNSTWPWASAGSNTFELRAHSSNPSGSDAERLAATLLGTAVATGVAGSTPAPTPNATFVSQSVPSSMTAGQSYPVSLTFSNSGNTTWASGAGYKLGSQNPQDNTTWGFSRVTLPYDVAPGQQATFSFNAIAPNTAGTYNFQWRLLQEGVQWFGGSSSNVTVTVTSATPNPPSTGNLVTNGGFESPYVSTYDYVVQIPGWTKLNYGSVVQRNGSAWGAPTAPEGSQTAVLQNAGGLSTTLTLNPGEYTLSFKSAPRTTWGGQQTIQVQLNGSPIYTVTPTGSSFSQYQTSFSVCAGSNTISFIGMNTSGDNAAFLDDVQVVAAASNPPPTTSTTAFKSAHWRFGDAAMLALLADDSGPAPTPRELSIISINQQFGKLKALGLDTVTIVTGESGDFYGQKGSGFSYDPYGFPLPNRAVALEILLRIASANGLKALILVAPGPYRLSTDGRLAWNGLADQYGSRATRLGAYDWLDSVIDPVSVYGSLTTTKLASTLGISDGPVQSHYNDTRIRGWVLAPEINSIVINKDSGVQTHRYFINKYWNYFYNLVHKGGSTTSWAGVYFLGSPDQGVPVMVSRLKDMKRWFSVNSGNTLPDIMGVEFYASTDAEFCTAQKDMATLVSALTGNDPSYSGDFSLPASKIYFAEGGIFNNTSSSATVTGSPYLNRHFQRTLAQVKDIGLAGVDWFQTDNHEGDGVATTFDSSLFKWSFQPRAFSNQVTYRSLPIGQAFHIPCNNEPWCKDANGNYVPLVTDYADPTTFSSHAENPFSVVIGTLNYGSATPLGVWFGEAIKNLTTYGSSAYAYPNPIAASDTATTVTYDLSRRGGVTAVQLRLGGPSGSLLYQGGVSGSVSVSASFLSNGSVIFVQDATMGNATSAANTVGTVTIYRLGQPTP